MEQIMQRKTRRQYLIAQMGRQKAAQEKENLAYAAGVQQAGLQNGLFQFTPEIMNAQMHQVISAGISKLTDITIKQNGLILDAKKANIEDKMDIYKQLQNLESEKYNTDAHIVTGKQIGRAHV